MMSSLLLPRSALVGLTSALAVAAATTAMGESGPSLNFYGASGLIDMPSGEAQPDGWLTVSSAHFGPVSRTTLSFQITPRLSGSFRYLGVRGWNDVVGSKFDTYYDRSFDLRYQVLTEGQYVPAVTVGLQDFIGTGIMSGEYVAATKTLIPGLKVTAGLGWGRLGSYGDIGSPFGARPDIDVEEGGKVNTGQWFRGPAAPFAGVEWQIDGKTVTILNDGIIHVEIDARSHAGTAMLRIRDHGPGVPEEQLAHLTQPFYRGNAARTSAMGSGLGLAIVERAIERMGGKFVVFNHANGGLMAVIELREGL